MPERQMNTEFHRIKRLPPYVFAEVNAMKAKARAAGEDIIDLGMPNPAYPIHPFGFIIADGAVRSLPCEPNADFIVALERAVRNQTPKPVALVLNYPSNPTAMVADIDFYGQVVEFCRHAGIWILSD